MDWKSFITDLASRTGQTVSFREPSPRFDLDALEREFNFRLPQQYRELMLQSNGIFDEFDCPVIDDVAGVRLMNRDARSNDHDCYMPLDHLFFVSSAYGNGDLLGYGIRRDAWEFPSLFRWDHGDDSRRWEAPDLKTWLEWCHRTDGQA